MMEKWTIHLYFFDFVLLATLWPHSRGRSQAARAIGHEVDDAQLVEMLHWHVLRFHSK